ncbi:MAG: NodT family efflux transporter outer membrane factor (OMF) lipoprotein [Psychromonas sp.]|jgi:NodT family efflux transporter outer membrane factor (OMF) lipoprotein|uniref:efflux transporter outer membrane subunit n=1 Tax=Psychromonas sp. TaxID=1884585 RepID=UPI0039E3A0B2
MNKNSFHLSTLIFCFLILTGCSSLNRSEFEMPAVEIPSNWPQESDSVTSSVQLDKWWMTFNNPELNSLIEGALQTNNDLALATLTLRKARLEAGLSEDDKLPDLSFSGALSNKKYFDSGDTDNSYSTNTSLSYELDLWGQLAAAADATQWAAQASFEDRESIAQGLVVTVASLYWKMGYLNQRISLAESNIKGIEQIIALTKYRYDNGSTTQLAVLESTQNLYKQQVSFSQLQQQLTESKNALAMLLNQPQQDAMLSIEKLPEGTLPDIASGIPADLLLRRPDVRSSLYQLKSMLASKDALDASYFPSLTLTGELGTSSSDLVELLQNPVGKLGTELTLPFLNWNKMKLYKNISEVDYQTAVINYRVTLYQAFEEVANYLSAKEHYHYQGETQQAQYTNTQEVEKIYASQYSAGAIDMIDWINALEAKRDAQASLLENHYNQFIIQAKLYQSLGGKDIAPKIQSNSN